MKNRKKQISFLCLLMMAGMMINPVLTVYAKGADYEETITFNTDDENEKRDEEFQQKIEVDGKTYRLTDITYKVIQTNKKEEKIIESEPIIYEQAEHKPLEEIIEDGITYKLKQSIGKEVVVKEAYAQSVEGYSDYDHAVTIDDVPNTKDVTVKNEKTGEDETVTCKLKNIETVDAGWKDTYIDIVFETYNAYVFNWNGVEIPRNTEAPLLGHEKELLESVGANTTDYRVIRIYWTSDAYTNEKGVLCRNARANVQKHSINYRANYVGEMLNEEELGMIFVDTYEYQEGDGNHYVVEATANYEATGLLTYMAVGGLLLLVILIILILYVLSKKNKKKEE